MFHCAPPPFVFLRPDFVFPRQDARRPHGFRAALERSRLAAKDKTLPRVLDGYSAHPRTPNMCFGRARLQRAFSFRRYLRREVALQQPKVAAQLPTGGDVSYPCPCVAWRFSLTAPMLPDGATHSKAVPEETASAMLATLRQQEGYRPPPMVQLLSWRFWTCWQNYGKQDHMH